MEIKQLRIRLLIIGALVSAITFAHYVTDINLMRYHVLYRDAYFFVVVLAGLWFGLRGALTTSLCIGMLNLPFIVINWQAMSAADLDRLSEVVVLYNLVATVVGTLRDREWAKEIFTRESESLAVVGKAVSALAHDMKTPLVAIGGFARLVKNQMVEGDSGREKLDIIISETGRLEKMLKDMLDFSKPLEIERSMVDLSALINECTEIVAKVSERSRIQVQNRSNCVPSLPVDPVRVKQVILNLLLNAVEASPEGEKVTIQYYSKGQNLIIDVIDCGCGIPAERREDIFTPFFTTKKHGTGLGLPIVRKIVEAHEGQVKVIDNPSGGLTFRVIIPRGVR